ncbi:MAG: hypothetical protein AB1635_11110 [Acidobacteriota bacterium]
MTVVDSPEGTALKLEGRVTGRWADELRAASEGRAALDLGWVTFVDRHGASVLSELSRQGVRLLHVPRSVAALLDGSLS